MLQILFKTVVIVIGIGFGYLGGFFSTLLFFGSFKKGFNLEALILGFVVLALCFGLGYGGSLLLTKCINLISVDAGGLTQDVLLLTAIGYIVSASTIIIYFMFFAK